MTEAIEKEVVPVGHKRTYRTVSVQQLDAQRLRTALGERAIVAIDIAKTKMMVGFATALGTCVEIARFEHPTQTRLFLMLLARLRELGVALEAVMEPTGVYGDSLCAQLVQMSVPVFRVDAKKVHDLAEVLDGVPSLHDAKACTLIAHAHAQRLSRPWRERSDSARVLRCLVDERDLSYRPYETACGQLEALVARHWPELCEHMEPQRSWHLHLLNAFPSPSLAASRPDDVAALLRRVTRANLREGRLEQIVACAHDSLGAPSNDAEQGLMRALTARMLLLREAMRDVEARIDDALVELPELATFRATFGAVTTAVILADVGNPADYHCAAAFEKALGLNLKIESSGEDLGRGTVHITKRGPARPRKYLFLAALRMISSRELPRSWYQARRSYGDIKLPAVVALMRKIARAMVHVAKGHAFDAERLFDARRLRKRSEGSTPTLAAATA